MRTLILLGTGTCSNNPARSMAAHALIDGEETVLLDCGPGALRRMAETGLSVHRVRAILFSHLHADHTGDLAALLFARRNDPGGPGPQAIDLLGPPGLAESLRHLESAHGGHLIGDGPAPSVREWDPVPAQQEARVGPWRVTAVRVDHGPRPAYGYRLAAEGVIVAYSGDSGPCDGLLGLARGADLFLCECSTPDEAPVPGHLTPAQVGEISARAGCCRVVLTHLYPMMESLDVVEAVRARFAGEVIRGADGMVIPL